MSRSTTPDSGRSPCAWSRRSLRLRRVRGRRPVPPLSPGPRYPLIRGGTGERRFRCQIDPSREQPTSAGAPRPRRLEACTVRMTPPKHRHKLVCSARRVRSPGKCRAANPPGGGHASNGAPTTRGCVCRTARAGRSLSAPIPARSWACAMSSAAGASDLATPRPAWSPPPGSREPE